MLNKNALISNFENWWAHKLDRPIIQVTLNDASRNVSGDFFGSEYRKKILSASYDMNMPVEEAAKVIEQAYLSVSFLGDAFPVFYMRPTGVLGAYIGQSWGINQNLGTVWFNKTNQTLEEIADSTINMNNPLLERSIALTEAAQKCFNGNIAIGFPDFGGVFDILASMYDPNELLPDLYDDEEAVKKAANGIFECLKSAIKLFESHIDIQGLLGYTCWATMLSQKPYYVMQNDFSAMIGPKMFDDYYLPILREESRMVDRTFYHLDGPGAVCHLDSIVSVDEIAGVQWVNGAGAAGLDQWPDIYRKIIAKNKLCQVFINGANELHYIDNIVDIVGTTKGLCFICTGNISEEKEFEKYLCRYGVI